MRYCQLACALTLVLFRPLDAQALDAAASGACVAGTHEISVSGYYFEENGGEVVDGEIAGLVLECQAIGVCEPGFFYPESPLPFDAQPGPGGYLRYHAEFSIDPPLSGVAYRYIPYGVRPDGSLVHTEHHCDGDQRSYALVGCPDIPISRGTMVFDSPHGGSFNVRIDPCNTNCWTEIIGSIWDVATVEELSGESWQALCGQVVDVFGERTYCSMPDGDYHEISRIALAVDGDHGPVPVREESWGGLKARYR